MYSTVDHSVNTAATMHGHVGGMSVNLSITQPSENICATVVTLPVQCGANSTSRRWFHNIRMPPMMMQSRSTTITANHSGSRQPSTPQSTIESVTTPVSSSALSAMGSMNAPNFEI